MTQADPPLTGRIALVTGASRGIGRASALALAAAGAHVIACARTQGALEELDDEIRQASGQGATLVPLDVREGGDIDVLGGEVFRRWGRLDILVHAAGDLGLVTPVAQLEPRTWDRALAVNMSAAYRLIRAFDPLLRTAEAGRAVFLTSRLASEPCAFWGPYAASKAGMEALVRVYADEVEHTRVRCVLLDPGPMRTRMRATAFPGEDPETLPPPEAVAPLLLELVRPDREPPQETVRLRAWAEARAA